MDNDSGSQKLVDPEVRAYVFSLVSALGGSSTGDDGRYMLGDDALAVLKDIKKWLKLFDDKSNRLDVNRLLAEANIVKGDLLQILAGWPEDAPEGSFRSKISLLCVDLLTQLTWPVEKEQDQTRLDHFLHIPYLKAAQAVYKRAILEHESCQMLRTVARVALPALAEDKTDRTPMGENIIKVVLYLFRNVAMISKPQKALLDEDDNEISRSATIDAFHKQGIFDIILMLCSNMQEDYQAHDVEVMDILFHLVKGIDVEKLFMERDEVHDTNTKELQELLCKEKGMHADYARHAPSRHNRFGTMMWSKRDDGKMVTIHGQSTLATEYLALARSDKSKKWKRPRGPVRNKESNATSTFDGQVALTESAKRHFRAFVEKFLDSSFNPLFASARRALEREADRVLEYHSRQFYYLVSWFLRAEHSRRSKTLSTKAKDSKSTPVESFSLVASVLNQETFVLINRAMQKSQDDKTWQDLNAQMKCFTQILVTIQHMTESPLDEDQDIAENILSRIFYEQTTHDRIINLLRTFKDQTFGYLDACTELSHVFLRLLERYSKQNVDLQVRSRRRARRKRKDQLIQAGIANLDEGADDNEAVDIADAHVTVTERKFEFSKFAAKFINQGSCDTYIALLRYYRELNPEQLKRCHRFLYRSAFKMDMATYLFRVDIIALLFKMVKGPEGLNTNNPTFKDWEEFSRQLFRRLTRRLEERPALAVEILFSKIPSTMFYLEHGYEKEVPTKTYRPPAEVEVKPGMTHNEELGVLVSLLINQNKFGILEWCKAFLSSASEQRKMWEDDFGQQASNVDANGTTESQDIVAPDADVPTTEELVVQSVTPHVRQAPSIYVKPDTVERRIAVQRDKHVRLLFTLLGMEPFGFTSDSDPASADATWTIPSSISSKRLRDDLAAIQGFEFNPPTYEDGQSPEDYIRRKVIAPPMNATRKTMDGDDDQSGGESLPSDIDNQLFPAGGPTIRRPSRASTPKKTRHRNRHDPDANIDERVLEERREARRKLQEEKLRKIKSSLYVNASDDETDEEADRAFFDKENRRHQENAKGIAAAMKRAARQEAEEGNKRRTMKRNTDSQSQNDDSSDDSDSPRPSKRRRSRHSDSDSEVDSDVQMDDSQTQKRISSRVQKPQPVSSLLAGDEEDDGLRISSSSDASEAETEPDGTPPTSQHRSSGQEEDPNEAPHKRGPKVAHRDPENSVDSDKENVDEGLPPRLSMGKTGSGRNVRAGFVIESDEED